MKRFTTLFVVLALIVLATSGAFAQNVIDYSFVNTTDPYTDLGALGDTIATATLDDAISAPVNIGFTFKYAGTNFTQFKLNTNAWITFDVGATSTTNYTAVGGSVADVIAAFSRDLVGTSVFGPTQYRVYTSGSVGSRICKIQWNNIGLYNGGAQSGNFRIQVWLYETSNIVEIRYGTSTLPNILSPTVQVGLKGGSSLFSTNTRALYSDSTGGTNWTNPLLGVNGASTMAVRATAGTLPDSARVYRFTPPASGSPLAPFAAYTIDNSLPTGGSNYASFAEAFSALNTKGVSGPTTFTVSGAGAIVTYNEANLTLGGVLPSGANTPLLSTLSATNTLTFVNDAGKTINLSGQGTSTSDFAIRLAGVDYVTFDGINVIDTVASIADSTNRRLEYAYVLCNASNADGATNNVIKNFTANLRKTNGSVASFGAVIANGTSILGTTTGTAGAYASRANNNKIQNFFITNVKRGVQLDGLPYPAYNEGNEVSGPAFTSAAGGVWTGGSRVTNFGTSSTGTDYGVGIDGEKGAKVFNVQIDGGLEFLASSAALSGIHFGISASGSDGCNEVEIYNCVIRNLENISGATNTANGIRCSGTAFPHTVKIYNTAIYDLRNGIATGANGVVGIQLTSSIVGNKFELYNNSIHITNVTAAAGTAKGIGIDGNAGNIVIAKNNAVSVTGGGATGGAIGLNVFSAQTFLNFSNNVYDVGTTSATRRVAVYPATARINLIDWQSALASATVYSDGIDQGSAYGTPGFVGATDLTYGASNLVNNSGVAISGLSTAGDILGVARGSNPDVGVFEGDFSAGFVDAASAGITITPLEGSVASEIRVIITDNRQGGAGTDSLKARLWYRGTPFTGAFSEFGPDVAPADSGNGEYRWSTSLRSLAAGTYQYYIVVRDSAGNSFAAPTMVAGGVAPGFSVSPADPGYLGANPFASAGVRTFQNVGTTLAAGTYSVGPTGTYASLTAVAADLSARPLTGNVLFELQATYTGAGEVYPIVFNQPSYTVAGPVTITIRPDATVAAPLTTIGTPVGTNPLIVLDGMRDLTIDGRPGGTGSTSMWTFRNAKDSAAINNCGPTFALVSDASRNTLKYLLIQGNASVAVTAAPWQSLGINAGVVSIGGTFYGGKGNNNNTVDNCEIMNNPVGAVAVPSNPLRGIISFGAVNSYNGGNTFSNNKIHDYFSPATSSAIGIQLQQDGGSTITGNSFYQTAPRTTTVSIINILCSATTAPGWTITNNFIGGSAPGATGGPLVDSVLAAGTGGFQGLNVSTLLNTSGTTISGNVIRNIFFKSASTGAVVAQLAGMILAANQYPVLVQDNVIGDNTVDASASPSILIQTTASVTHTYFGIFSGNGTGTGGALTIRRNQIGGVRINTAGTLGGSFTGILNQFTGAPLVVDSNFVGSAGMSNSIYQTSNAVVVGIQGTSPIGQTSVNGNVVANITLASAASATASTFTGMTFSTTGTYTMTNNVVRNITSNSNAATSHLGIIVTSAGLNNLIQGNTVRDFAFTPFTPATATNIFGIAIVNTASTGRMLKNQVYNIVNNSTSTSGGIFGIANQGGLSWTYSNNMVSLGTGSSGDINIIGMQERSAAAGPGEINYVYNSVWISGTVPTGALPTYAFSRTGTVNGAIVSVKNNVFQNDRSGLPGNARGFAIGNTEATGANGWLATSSDRNLLKGNTDSVAQWLGVVTANNRTLAGWQAAQPGGSGGDANSKVGDAQFNGLTDLHVNTAAVTASSAANIGAPTALEGFDVDGNTRSATTPDAGYDEFTLPAPAAFALTSPANAALGQPLSVTLNWTASAQVENYDLYIGVGSLPGSPTVTGITGTSYVFAAAPSSTYFWNIVAKNADASTSSSNGAFTFTTISPPAAPTGLIATATGPVPPPEARIQQVKEQAEAGLFSTKAAYLAALNEARGLKPGELRLESSVSGINLSWTDNAASGGNTEDSFYVYAKLNSAPVVGGHASPDFLAAVDSSLGSGATVLYTHGPLALNQTWYYKVTAKNAQGESASSDANTTTFVNTPGASTFSDVRWNRMVIHLDINGNPGTTETYAIRNTEAGQYVSATGTISSATEVWRTYAAWGAAGGQLLTGLTRGTAYTFEVKARNDANVETAFGPTASQATTFDQPISQLSEDFTSVAFPPAGWTLLDEATVRWSRNTVSTQPNNVVGPMAKFDFFNALGGETDTLITPAVNLTGAISVSLNWNHSYRTYTSLDPDSVFVMISSDGGTTWSALQTDGYPTMATRAPNTSSLGPVAAADWKLNTVDIPAIYFTSTVKIAWRAKSAFGNNYWLDDITLQKKVAADNITVTMNLDADASFGTSGDRSPKVWHLALRTGSPTGPVVTEGDVSSLTASNVIDGTYYAVASDSGAGWAHIGQVRNGTPVAGSSRIDTIVLAGGGINWTTDFVVAVDTTEPVIAYNLVSSTVSGGAVVLAATITDNLGVDVSVAGKPRMWYRSGSSIPLAGAYTAVSGVAVSGDTSWTFSFPALSSVTFVEYYVAAQDNAGNAVTEPSGTAYTTNPPNGTVAGNRFVVASPLTFTVGTAGANFPSITEGLTWFYGGIDGPMQFLLNSDYTSAGETFPITIAGIPGMGARPNAGPSVKPGRGNIVLAELEGIPSLDGKKDFSKLHYDASKVRRIPGLGLANRTLGTNPFVIKPNTAATPGAISGVVNSPDGSLIILDGASGVTIQNLSIENSGDEGAVWITGGSSNNRIVGSTLKSNATFAGFSAGTITIADYGLPPGSNNNAIVNCNVSGNGGPNFSAIGIYSGDGVTVQDADTISGCTITGFGDTSPSGFSVGISILDGASNLVIENNDISTPIPVPGGAAGFVFGIAFSGLTGPANVNCIIRNNVIHDINATGITTGLIGGIIIAQASTGALVEGNTIRDIGATTVATNGAAATRGVSLTVATGTTVSRNVIKDLQNASPASIVTAVRHVGAGSSTFVNNVIVLGNVGLSTTPYRGIQDAAAGIDTTRVLFNSVYIGGVATSGTSDASVRTGASNSVLRNNIFMNERDGGAGFHYGIRSTPVSGGTFNSDYNDVYVTGATNGVFGAFAGVNQATLALWQTASAGDANSKDTDPLFVDPTSADLHIKNGIGDMSPTANAGIVYGGVTVDIDNETGKRATTPDIGADEFNLRAPVAFNQLTPANGAINVPVAGSLTWDGMPLGATAFDVYLNSSATATTLLAGNITASTTPYSGLLPDSTYVWSVVAKNSDSSTTATGAPFNFATILSTVNVNVSIAAGWNMISNPVIAANDSLIVLYPTSLFGYGFSFSGGYVTDYTMENGTGYWGKFPGVTSQVVSGLPNTRDTIDVIAGWNLVGSVSNSVDTSTIVSIPSGIRASNWFGYAAGYVSAANILPGQAYWVKSNAVGQFVLANPLLARPAKVQPSSTMQSVDDVLNTLTITDSRGGSQTLYFGADGANSVPVTMYAMPPMPPVGAFDARFETSDGGSMVQTHALQVADVLELPVRIQSEAYPLTITWNVNKGIASYELTDGRGGSVFHAKEMRGEGSMKITNSSVSKFAIKLVGDGSLPKEFSLSQNYPNPFNPTTNIKFALPVLSRVEAEIYNVLGQRVSTLVKEELAAGYHVMEWNGTSSTGQQVGSGTYFLKLSATGANGKVFTEVRKLLMLK